MEGELIFMAFVMLIGQIIMLQMWNAQWFKKENFKIQKSNVMATNKLNLRKLERELGLTQSRNIVEKEPPGIMSTIGDLAPLLKNLNEDQLAALADKFLGGAADETEGGGITEMVTDFATKNPEMVKQFLGGLADGEKGKKTGGQSQV